MKTNALRQIFVLGISLGTIILGGSKLLSFILKLIVSHLGVVNFGEYYLATSTFLSLTTLAALGIPMSVTRFVSYLRGKGTQKKTGAILSSAFIIMAISGVLFSVILFIFAHSIALFLGVPHLAQYFHILSFGLLGALCTQIVRAIFLGYIRIQSAYIADGIEIFLKFLFVFIGVWWMQWGVLGAIIGYTTGTLAASVINAILMIKQTPRLIFPMRFSPVLISYTWPVSVSEIITAFVSTILIYIVKIHGGGIAVGLYAAAVSVAALIHLLPQMILSVFLPVVSKRYAKQKEIVSLYTTTLRWLVVMIVPLGLYITVSSSTIVNFIFGNTYNNASGVLSVLILAYGLYALFIWPNRQLLDIAGFTKHNLLLTILRAATSIAFLCVFPSQYTGVGLARAILFGWIVEAMGCFYFVKREKLI